MAFKELLNRNGIIIISGPYGAGKTNIAVNLAMYCAVQGLECRIADLDTVNPYFRTADNAKKLEKLGVEALIPEFANTNVDIPALPKSYDRIFAGSGKSIIDVGGDADGAAVLGFSHDDYTEAGYDMYFVYNRYRPLTAEPEDALDVMRSIERASGLRFCGVINNSNLGAETTASIVGDAVVFAEKLASLSGLPLVMTTSPEWAYVPGTQMICDITKKLF